METPTCPESSTNANATNSELTIKLHKLQQRSKAETILRKKAKLRISDLQEEIARLQHQTTPSPEQKMKTTNQNNKDIYISPASFKEDTEFMTCNKIDRININTTTPLEFYQKYVSQSKPCILTNAIDHWPAIIKWNDAKDTILSKCIRCQQQNKTCGRDRIVTCNYTPHGAGDHIVNCEGDHNEIFVKPEERNVKFGIAWDELKSKNESNGIPYLSIQNDSLREQFTCLGQDIDVAGLQFANQVFHGQELSAVNLWIGDNRSTSSVHKDPFDNIYCVVRGVKTFTLLPPTDVRYLYEKPFPIGSYYQSKPGEKFAIVKEKGNVPWCQVDPLIPDLKKYPDFIHASPIHVEVKQGETLFLPALWYHRVGSSGPDVTIAVNYWYDMKFGPVYTCYEMARRLTGLKKEMNIILGDEGR